MRRTLSPFCGSVIVQIRIRWLVQRHIRHRCYRTSCLCKLERVGTGSQHLRLHISCISVGLPLHLHRHIKSREHHCERCNDWYYPHIFSPVSIVTYTFNSKVYATEKQPVCQIIFKILALSSRESRLAFISRLSEQGHHLEIDANFPTHQRASQQQRYPFGLLTCLE